MAFRIKYHRLFEVRFFHSYYLKDEAVFYAKNDLQKATELIEAEYNILNYLEFEPTPRCKELLKQHNLRFKAFSTGFLVGVETKPSENGPDLLSPSRTIEPETTFDFQIKSRNPIFSSITNYRIQPSIPAQFWFNNYENLNEKLNLTIPNIPLSQSPIEVQTTRKYEMGELVLKSGSNKYFKAKKIINGTSAVVNGSNWEGLTNYYQTVNYQDRQIIPSKEIIKTLPNGGLEIKNNVRFTYRVKANTGVVVDTLNFELVNPEGNSTANFSVTDTNHINATLVKFDNIPTDLYTLNITGSNGYAETRTVLIDPERFNPTNWGIISIQHKKGLSNFRILEDSGDMRIKNGTTELEYPIYEIRLDNRDTFWKYILHSSDSGYTIDNTDFKDDGTDVYSKNPKPLSKFYKETILPPKPVPNPTDLAIRLDASGERYVSEIRLPKMNIP